MDQVPKDTLPTTLLILCANQHSRATTIPHLSALFGFSQSAIFDAVETLYSVIEMTQEPDPELNYYHASFTDFLTTPERSTFEYCINTRDVFLRLYHACLDAAICPLSPLYAGMYFFRDLARMGNTSDPCLSHTQIDFSLTLRRVPTTKIRS
jgi:hypothetical protein